MSRSHSQGPSPRVRGSRWHEARASQPQGTIPACAGEPIRICSRPSRPRDHPRVCGGAEAERDRGLRVKGPSPRVRGSPGGPQSHEKGSGTIPACAGEPSTAQTSRSFARDHPRVCGGAVRSARAVAMSLGPSPRVRGSLALNLTRQASVGTIPACAGEPKEDVLDALAQRDHPRVCGGAPTEFWTLSSSEGPSPRVRGSHATRRRWIGDHGTIPACAGEPGR